MSANIPPAGTRVRFIGDRPNDPFFPPRGTLGTLGYDGSSSPPVVWDDFPGRTARIGRYVNLARVEVVTAEPTQLTQPPPPALIELATITMAGRRQDTKGADIFIGGDALNDDFRPKGEVRVTVPAAVIDRVTVGRQYKLVLVELPEVDKA
jgi:hypothetical protein